MEKRKIEDFLNNEIKNFSIAVIKSRAIPSVIDGFKPVQRKIIYTADKTAKSFIKTISLIGNTISIGGYYMGDASIEGAIDNMVQNFSGANNIPFLEGEGAFGSRLVPEGIASARYTKTKISKNFYNIFSDFELLEYEEQDGDYFEPKYYLPIIPTVLINPISGIAIGFACEIQPYNIIDIIENIRLILDNKDPKKILPYFKNFKGEIKEEDGVIYCFGRFEIINSTTIRITEVPIYYSLEKYKNILINLEEKKIIESFKDNSKNGFDFEVRFKKERLKLLLQNNKIYEILKLKAKLNENLILISEDSKLLQFQNVNEIIKYFVNFRLGIYKKRKNFFLNKYKKEIEEREEKIRFIEIIRNIDLKRFKNKKDLKDFIIKNGFKNIEDLAGIQLYNLNREFIEKLKNEIEELKKKLENYEKISDIDLYKKDLEKLEEYYKKEFR